MYGLKYFRSFTGKYNVLTPYSRFQNISLRNHFKTKNKKCVLPPHYLMAESLLGTLQVLTNYSSIKQFSTQVANSGPIPNECSSTVNNEQLIKFEDMLFQPPVPQEELMATLQKCKTITEQMETFSSTMALSSDDVENRKRFCKTLELKIKPFFKDSKIQVFGSSVNCFGFKGCDLDMTFETPVEAEEKVFSFSNLDVPSLSEALSGKVSPVEISKLPSEGKLLFIYNILMEYYKESNKAVKFIKEVPLVRLHHDKFNLKCDLTTNNSTSIENAKLLNLFVNFDKRVAPFVRNILGWARSAELIGKRFTFNTFSIDLLAIHFLQTRNPPIIPSAESLLSSIVNFENSDVDDNNYLDLLKNISLSNNTQTLGELLKEFFFYYLYFDFTRVITPLKGTSIPRKEFNTNTNGKFVVNTLCIQDPMWTSNNVTKRVEGKMFLKMYSEITTICKMFQDNIISTPTSVSWGLMNILNKPSQYTLQNPDVRQPVHFTLPCLSQLSTEGNALGLNSSFTRMSAAVLKVVEHVLLFDCIPIEKDNIIEILEKQEKVLDEQKIKRHLDLSGETMVQHFRKVNAENELILCCECKVSRNVWTGREFVILDKSELSLDLLNKEHLISKKVARQNELNTTSKDQKKTPYSYLLECYIASNSLQPSILVYFRPLPEQLKTMYFQKLSLLGIFLKDYVPKTLTNPEMQW